MMERQPMRDHLVNILNVINLGEKLKSDCGTAGYRTADRRAWRSTRGEYRSWPC